MKKFAAVLLVLAAFNAIAAPELPDATASKLPRWRGFNLLEKFMSGHQGPFKEEDFQLISELGFNFVRLPMDYRCWIANGDWRQINDDALKDIDQAVEFGKKYGIHVCLNFHRAPGYTVAKPPEAKSIWTNAEALEVCSMHWAHFAKRYKGVPNRNLSFNLMNEPANVEAAVYGRVVKALVEAIRSEDPERLVIADGRSWGKIACDELVPLKIAQATRGYAPGEISHYKASWAGGERYPLPTWPILRAYGMIYGPQKKPLNVPFVIEGDLPDCTLRMKVHEVSNHDTLVVRADGAPIWTRKFTPGKDDADCKTVDQKKSWPFGTYDRDYAIPLRAGTKKLELIVTDGDWLSLSEIGLTRSGGRELMIHLKGDWGRTNTPIRFAGFDADTPFPGLDTYDRAWLQKEMIEPWQALQKQGVGVIVGEFGAYNKTPHDVTLHWLEDCLKNWRDAGWGWAMWNFRGAFGILDSERADVNYEDFHGHKLDRKMLELLKRY